MYPTLRRSLQSVFLSVRGVSTNGFPTYHEQNWKMQIAASLILWLFSRSKMG